MNFYPFGQAFVDPQFLFTDPLGMNSGRSPFRNLFSLFSAPQVASVPITSLTGRTLQRYIESLETRAAQAAQGIGSNPRLTVGQTRNLIAQMQREGWRMRGGVDANWAGGTHINFIGPSGQTLHLPVPPGFVP